MYHKTARQVRKIRKKIEKETGGKFDATIGEGGVKEFFFKKKPEVVA